MRWTLLFFLSINLLLLPVVAQEEFSHDELLLTVKTIDKETNLNPEQLFLRIKRYIEHARTSGWKNIEVLAFSQLANAHGMMQQFDEALAIADKYQPVAESLKDTQAILNFLSVRLDVFDARNDANNAATIRKHYEAQALAFGKPEEIGHMYTQVASSLQYFGDLPQSLLKLQKALVIFDKLPPQSGKALTLNAIGTLYNLLDDHQQALKYNKRSMEIYLLLGDKSHLSASYHNLGTSYFKVGQLSQAKKYLEKSLLLSTEFKDSLGMAFAFRNLAKVAAVQKDYAYAQVHFSKALTIFKGRKNSRLLLDTSLGLAKVMDKLDSLDEAIDLLTPLEEIANRQSRKGTTVEYYELLYRLEKKRKNFSTALTALEKAKKAIQLIYDKEKEDSLQKLIVKFEANQKEADNKLLQQQNELALLRLHEQESQQTIMIMAFFIVIIAVALLIYFLIKQMRHRNRYKVMALRDELTGAPNRRAIMAHGNKKFEKSRKDGSVLTIAMLDIDHFKSFNDSYGHDIGDEVLKVFSDACGNSIRSHDHYGRFGGEEWMLVLQDVQEKHIKGIFERLSHYLNKTVIKNVPKENSVTFSLGSAQLRDNDSSLEQVIKRADENLYKAKESGRNQYVTCDSK